MTSRAKAPPRGAVDLVEFIKTAITRNEHDEPFTLMPFQEEILRLAFTFDAQGKLSWDSLVLSMVKKSGKTTLNAAILAAWGFTQEKDNTILISGSFEVL